MTTHASERYTSRRLLAAETDLLDAAQRRGVEPVPAATFDRAVRSQHDAVASIEQREAARRLCLDGHIIACLVGPAGAGKTTTLRLATQAWRAAGRRVIALAPSAAAAQVLRDELSVPADTLHKFLHDSSAGSPTPLRRGDIVLIDEAGMAGTMRLAAVVSAAEAAGACVRMVGDPAQLAAVEAGGAFRLLVQHSSSAELTALHRFRDAAEARATMAIRRGDGPCAAAYYAKRGRLRLGETPLMAEAVFAAWRRDIADGLHSLMVTVDKRHALLLNERAQIDRQLASDGRHAATVPLHDGTVGRVSDTIVTRANARLLLTDGGRDFVKNGDAWTVVSIASDGGMHVRRPSAAVRLPSAYVSANVELGYAVTVHRAQGLTCDTTHALISDATTREHLYVAASRGRQRNHVYIAHDADTDEAHATVAKAAPTEAATTFTACVARTSRQLSATKLLTAASDMQPARHGKPVVDVSRPARRASSSF